MKLIPAVLLCAVAAVAQPICNAGAQQTFRAGFSGTLNGNGSSGTSLTYAWKQLSGPTRVRWTNQNTATPTVTRLAFGTYVFQLTVTDNVSSTDTCTVKDGAVYTDDNGIVKTTNPVADKLLGTMVRWGANPWPWYDNRHKAVADFHVTQMQAPSGRYRAYWLDTAHPGKVTIHNGETTVVGTGTAFKTTFCNSDGTTKANSPRILIAYPIDAAHGIFGNRQMWISSCADDTHLTVTRAWRNDVADAVSVDYYYSDYSIAYGWERGDQPANYYDAVAAFYSLYYRSGIDDYLTAAQTLADRWWNSPNIDHGNPYTLWMGSWDNTSGFGEERDHAIMGLVLRASEVPRMWTDGLSRWLDDIRTYKLDTQQRQGAMQSWGIYDMRESAYVLAAVSYCAMFNPDTAKAGACKDSIVASFQYVWDPFRHANGMWEAWYAKWDSWGTPDAIGGGYAHLVNGSNHVVFSAATFSSLNDVTLYYDGGAQTTQNIWFTSSYTTGPHENTDGDQGLFQITNWISSNTLQLDRNWTGATGDYGYAIGDINAGGLGWGAQPFMAGMLGAAFDFAARALDRPTDTATHAKAVTYNIAVADWIRTKALRTDNGMYYLVDHRNCNPPTMGSLICTANNDAQNARVLDAEAIRGIWTGYANATDPTEKSALKTTVDTLYGAMFTKPGDGNYLTMIDDGGWYIIPGYTDTRGAQKWLGMLFGFAGLSSWPGTEIGGLGAPNNLTSYVGYNLSTVPGAVSALIRPVYADGTLGPAIATCSSSPCGFPVASGYGNPAVRIQYLDGSGRAIVTGEPFFITVR